MKFVQIDTNIDADPKIERAGWAAARVFELLLKVSGRFDLHGELGPEHLDPQWLARRWNLTAEDGPSLKPANLISAGICRLLAVGVLVDAGNGHLRIKNWEKWHGARPKSDAERAKTYRERKSAIQAESEDEPSRSSRDASRVTPTRRDETRQHETTRNERDAVRDGEEKKPPTPAEAANPPVEAESAAGGTERLSKGSADDEWTAAMEWLERANEALAEALPRKLPDFPDGGVLTAWRREALGALARLSRPASDLLDCYRAFLRDPHWLKAEPPCPWRAFAKGWQRWVPNQGTGPPRGEPPIRVLNQIRRTPEPKP